jgi:hypothetical protein
MRIIIVLVFILCQFSSLNGQNDPAFCKAVRSGDFRKAEHKVKQIIKLYQYGSEYNNGPGSGIQITFTGSLDSVAAWLKSQSCVEDAFWDKCEFKEDIYPGWSVMGAKFMTDKGVLEKCFSMRQGTTGRIRILGWKPKISKARTMLVYKKMYDCPGFIERQKQECTHNSVLSRLLHGQADSTEGRIRLIPVDSLIGKWVNSFDNNDTIEFSNAVYSSTIVMTQSIKDMKTRIMDAYSFRKARNRYVEDIGRLAGNGYKTCIIELLANRELEIVFSNCSGPRSANSDYCFRKYKYLKPGNGRK